MKTILTIAAASALFGISGCAMAEPAGADHANHNHAAPTAPATPATNPAPAPSQGAMNCSHMMQGGAAQSGGMGAMSGMADKPGGSMDHHHMMGGDMKGCEHMKHEAAAPSPAPSSTPKP